MDKLNKKMKIGIVVSVAWLLIVLIITLANPSGYSFSDGESLSMEDLAIFLGYGIILIGIGWSIWWIKQED